MEELSFAVGRVPRPSSRVVSCLRDTLLRVYRLEVTPFGLRLQGHDAVSGKVMTLFMQGRRFGCIRSESTFLSHYIWKALRYL